MSKKVWNPNMPLADNGTGIKLIVNPGGDVAFINKAQTALDTIYATTAGRQLLDALITKIRQGKYLTIKPPRGMGNECQAIGQVEQARTLLARHIDGGNTLFLKNCLKIAINRAFLRDYQRLCDLINNTPRYRIRDVPNTQPSHLGVLKQDIERWLDFDDPRPMFYPFTNNPQDLQDLKNILLIIFNRAHADTKGSGCHSRINWDADKHYSTNTIGNRVQRPSYIGLSHELCHAYHNLHGSQIAGGEDANSPTGMLFEHLCVGIGPWANTQISENGVRRDANMLQRQMY